MNTAPPQHGVVGIRDEGSVPSVALGSAAGAWTHPLQRLALGLVSRRRYAPAPDYDEQYFQRGFAESQKFFSRFPSTLLPSFAGRRFLDVGCGYGASCVYLATHGAARVVGIDIRQSVLDFAKEKLRSAYPDLVSKVSFAHVDHLAEAGFDCIMSKDSFEHYADPEAYIRRMLHWLAPGGRIYIGFAPLWKSPFGGHMDMVTALPWAHLVFSEQVLLEKRAQLTGEPAQHYSDVTVSGGLNQMTLRRFRTILQRSGGRVRFFRVNHSSRPLVSVFNMLRRLPGCEEYFTVNIYTVLGKP